MHRTLLLLSLFSLSTLGYARDDAMLLVDSGSSTSVTPIVKTETNPPEEEDRRPFTITLSPYLLAGGLSTEFSYSFLKHQGLYLEVYSDVAEDYVTLATGYRFYTGTRGASGFFVGPSVAYASGTWDVTSFPSKRPSVLQEHKVGVGATVGGQYIAAQGFTVGGGMEMFLYFGKRVAAWGTPFFKLGYSF